MIHKTNLALVDLICLLRQRLLDAQDQNNQERLRELQITFELLAQAAYEYEDKSTALILEDLEASARYSAMGVGWKAEIPSVEVIRSALS